MSLKTSVFFIFVLCFFATTAQVDTIFQNAAYSSYYSFQLKAPIAVEYKLYKGGGDCNRSKFHFRANKYTATNKDYSHSGYDKGHLANAEDFAYDCTLDSLTFMYYNCFPQTPELNRGIWKKLETKIRNESRSDSLIIICGGLYNENKIGSIAVPDTCWKVIYHLREKTFSECYLFTNTNQPVEMMIHAEELNAILKKRYRFDIFRIN